MTCITPKETPLNRPIAIKTLINENPKFFINTPNSFFNFRAVDYAFKSTPSFVDGILYTVVSERRQVVAIDPATGETLWVFREPNTLRFERSMRQNYGKGVAYAEIDGRGVIYITTPGFFLHALDAKTGQPLEGFGRPILFCPIHLE